MSKCLVAFGQYGKSVELSEGETILDAAKRAAISIPALCGGRGFCGKCRVIVTKGLDNLASVSTSEALSFSEEEISRGYRLACCSTILHDTAISVEVPLESNIEQQKLLIVGIETAVPLNPCVTKHVLNLPTQQIGTVRSDVEILFEQLAAETGTATFDMSHCALTQLPNVIREQNGVVTVTLHENHEVFRVQPGSDLNGPYGLAVDIGTTKLAAYLLDLSNASILATASSANPQIPYGDDLITRISYASENDRNLNQLRGVLVDALNALVETVCETAAIEVMDVCDVVAVGNTAMHHIFLGINPRFLALSPYPPAIRSAVSIRCDEIGLRFNPDAHVYLPPVVAGFVGADAIADVLATEIYEAESAALLIDIGTNTEIVMSDGHRLMACSCASGPAFEGGCIRHGMRAERGAIERVYIESETLEPGYRTIEDVPPRGICGSGVVDTLASMVKSGVIDQRGKINQKLGISRIRSVNGLGEYVLAWKNETAIESDITVEQKDIEKVQLAKAAIYSGISILMRHLRINASDIEQVFLAGAFGNYVDPESALTIGMYPDLPIDQIRFVGNSAGSGARMALLSKEIRREADDIARNIGYVELAADPDFQREFTDALYLPHRNSARFPRVAKSLAKRRRTT